MYNITKNTYQNKTIPKWLKLYNISNEPIEGLEVLKLLQLPKVPLTKFNEGYISKDELKEQYYRGLESRGQHLIGTDYRDSIMVCACKTYGHADNCPIPYLKDYLALKKFTLEKYN